MKRSNERSPLSSKNSFNSDCDTIPLSVDNLVYTSCGCVVKNLVHHEYGYFGLVKKQIASIFP